MTHDELGLSGGKEVIAESYLAYSSQSGLGVLSESLLEFKLMSSSVSSESGTF